MCKHLIMCVCVPSMPLVYMKKTQELELPPIIGKFEGVIGHLYLIDFNFGLY
jgi:hypothetical protein